MSDPKTISAGQIGRSLPRVEARAKVTGRAEYIHNLRLPGMLWAKIARSTVPHGRIRHIDTSAAQATRGVYSVITGEDILRVIPDPYFGPAFHDQPILALGKVRFAGEPVAVVLAEDPKIAEAAAQEISINYEELPAVLDEVETLTATTFVHEALKPAGMFADLKHLAGKRDTNVALDYHLRRGDVDKAFAAADHVFEHVFRTPQQMHTPLEPHCAIADATPAGVTVHSSTQTPSSVRVEIARLLGLPENRVRVRTAFLGGGFGAKVYVKMEALAVALSLLARRPVKVALTMEEQFFTISKHGSTFRIKSAVTKDGRITARYCEVIFNGGAYADIGPRVAQKSGFSAAGPYDIANVSIDSYETYTNRPTAGALRGLHNGGGGDQRRGAHARSVSGGRRGWGARRAPRLPPQLCRAVDHHGVGLARPEHYQHGAAAHRRRARRARPSVMGDHGLHADRDRYGAAIRQAQRHARAAAALRRSHRGLHRRLGTVRARTLNGRYRVIAPWHPGYVADGESVESRLTA
jgi:CO/xanthine dehydrogenase Mo-binding subunit